MARLDPAWTPCVNTREAQEQPHAEIRLRERECVHAPYHPWVESLPVGSSDVSHLLHLRQFNYGGIFAEL